MYVVSATVLVEPHVNVKAVVFCRLHTHKIQDFMFIFLEVASFLLQHPIMPEDSNRKSVVVDS